MLVSEPTSIGRLGSAHANAVSVIDVTESGTAPVYNISVEGAAEYFANGILVHNCDAFRYLLMSWPHLPEPVDPLVQDVDPGLSAKDLRDMERFAKHAHAEGEKIADGIGEFHQQAEDDDYGHYDSMYASY